MWPHCVLPFLVVVVSPEICDRKRSSRDSDSVTIAPSWINKCLLVFAVQLCSTVKCVVSRVFLKPLPIYHAFFGDVDLAESEVDLQYRLAHHTDVHLPLSISLTAHICHRAQKSSGKAITVGIPMRYETWVWTLPRTSSINITETAHNDNINYCCIPKRHFNNRTDRAQHLK